MTKCQGANVHSNSRVQSIELHNCIFLNENKCSARCALVLAATSSTPIIYILNMLREQPSINQVFKFEFQCLNLNLNARGDAVVVLGPNI